MSVAENTALVLLAGMDGTGELLRPLTRRLAAHRSVQVVDYPADRWLSYDQLVASVRERVTADRFVVLGESFSGPIAIELAATLVAGLVLASSFARHPLPSWLAAVAGWVDLKWTPAPLLIGALMGSAASPELKRHLRQILARLPRETVRGRIRDVLRVDKRSRLRKVNCPILCLHGRSDRLAGKRLVDDIVALQPACEVRWLDAPHMLLATHVEAAAVAIEDFCRRVDLDAR
jgi:pimeloyl-[acyl-carrier protein] methyl ester esterase